MIVFSRQLYAFVGAWLRAVAKGFGRAPSLKLWRKRPETGR